MKNCRASTRNTARTTEELETSKEELQSINEELQTVNQELKLKLEEVSRTRSDLENVMAATDVAILFVDSDLRIKRFTPALGQLFRIKTRDHDRPIGDLTHTLQYDMFQEDARQVMASQGPVERTVSNSDGRMFVVRVRPYRTDERRESEGVVATFIDVTAIKEAEAALRGSEQRLERELNVMSRLHRLTMAAATAPSMSDALGHILIAALTLLEARFGTVELVDRETHASDIVAHQGLASEIIPILKAINTREGSARHRAERTRTAIEVPDIWQDVAYSDVQADVEQVGYRSTQCSPLITRNDELVGVLSVYFAHPHTFSERDKQLSAVIGQQAADLIESREQHEALARLNDELRARTHELEASQERLSRQTEELLNQDRNREEFLAALGHELRNPLAAILSSLTVLGASDDRSRRAVAVLKRQTVHMTRLVNDLLDISRVKYGKLRLERKPIALTQWILSALEAVRLQAEAKGVQLRHEMPDVDLTVDADPERLAQILDNLLRNAITHTPRGAITVTVRQEGAYACIAVRDTGVGIDPANAGALFKPYYQQGGEERAGGLGLGLALVKALVEAHKGTVSVHSKGRDAGSEFSFTIPITRVAAVASQASGPVRLPTYRVLIVDDERDVGDMFGELLKSLGQDVTVTYGGEEALKVAHDRRPHVAFIDLAMPQMSGSELARRLRRQFPSQNLRLVAVSGHGKARAVGKLAEFDQYLLKPASRESVVALLSALAGTQT